MAGEQVNNISKSLAELISSEIGITEEEVRTIVNDIILNQVIGDLNNLNTTAKDLIVNAINELVGKTTDIQESIEEVFQLGNDVKQMLVDTLIANGIENISTSDTFVTLISYIDWFKKYKGFNILRFEVPANTTIMLQSDLRGDNTTGTLLTSWGDGTVDTELSHTYSSAGTYDVVTKYSVIDRNGTNDPTTISCLVNILNINNLITDASYMFAGCTGLTVIDANEWDTSNITNMNYMFYYCGNLITFDNDMWNTHNVLTAVGMFEGCFNQYVPEPS